MAGVRRTLARGRPLLGQAIARNWLPLALLALLGVGCSPQGEPHPGTTPPSPGNAAEHQRVVHEDLSANFTLTAYPSRVYSDDSGTYVSFHADIVNKSSATFRSLSVTIILDPELDQYLAAGVQPLPATAVDIFAQDAPEVRAGTGGRGVELVSDQLVADRTFLAEAGLRPSRILDLSEKVTLWLRWDGGEERLAYVTPVEDPEGLLRP